MLLRFPAFGFMTGLGLFDPKSVLAVAMPIAAAFKFCIRYRKGGP
jgi:hypothetical protein